MQLTKISWPTNLNNKLGCDMMVHIDKAPSKPIPPAALQKTIVEIHTADNSHSPTTWLLTAIYRANLGDLASVFTYPSHGMDLADFWAMKKAEGMTGETLLAVYYYERYNAKK